MKKILIVQSGFLGDVILSTPVIAALRELFPEAKLWFLTTPQAAPLVREHPELAGVLVFDKRGARSGIRGFFEMAAEIRALGCDLAVSLHKSFRTAALLRVSGIAQRIGFDEAAGRWLYTKTVPRSDQSHDVLRNLAICRAFEREPQTFHHPLRIALSADDLATAQAAVGEQRGVFRLGIAPGSVWATKRWTVEGFTEVARHFAQRGAQVVLIGGKEDRESAALIAQGAQSENLRNLCGELALGASAAAISLCDLFLSNDSAPLHLASAFKIPTTALFCATVPEFGFGPWENASEVLGVSGLACRPCGRHGGNTCPTGTHFCQRNLLARDVIRSLEQLHRNAEQQREGRG